MVNLANRTRFTTIIPYPAPIRRPDLTAKLPTVDHVTFSSGVARA
jgi:hypothetical protein